jgi:hypothetical protein
MTEKTKPKSAKKRPKKAAAQQSVLGNLPSTRPNRLARRHPEPAKTEAAPTTAEAPQPAAPAATTPRAVEPAKKAGTTATKSAPARRTAKPKATATAKSGTRTRSAARAKATPAAKPKAARKPEPVLAAAPEPAAAPKTFESTAAAEGAAAAAPSRPRPVRAGSPSLEQPERRESAPPRSNGGPPRGTELVTTAIQAAGELAQIGITVGSQLLKRTLDRLPRP